MRLSPGALVAMLCGFAGSDRIAVLEHADPMAPPKAAARALRPGHRWVRHQGTQEQLRRMRQSWRRVQKLKDETSELARHAIQAAVTEEPDPEYSEMHLTHAALVAAEEAGTSWARAVVHLLQGFERNRVAAEVEA